MPIVMVGLNNYKTVHGIRFFRMVQEIFPH